LAFVTLQKIASLYMSKALSKLPSIATSFKLDEFLTLEEFVSLSLEFFGFFQLFFREVSRVLIGRTSTDL
jgi:hypothetical protein